MPEVQMRKKCTDCPENWWKRCKVCKGTGYITIWVPVEEEFIGWGSHRFRKVYVIPLDHI